ncbi:MAG: chemotaxis response regulator protein-glutamate methylesterase [Clostridiales Family XIII bacterium]|jgi:two-component system chemotaxis response regulator CheB|nr:chemotaxis response regulator protein-glutamate methylesterase [Clostridiales Family XIII bacterium]
MQEIKVLAVDDSILFREMLSKGMGRFHDITVVGVAVNPFDAKDKIARLKPDVVTLDVEMPHMDGVKFLYSLMSQHPLPVVVISSLRDSVFDAMDAGAIDFIPKPDSLTRGRNAFMDEVAAKVRAAAGVKFERRKNEAKDLDLPPLELGTPADAASVIAIGASTGGTEAIFSILTKYGPNIPGFVVVQHMPEGFTKLFAQRLDSASNIEVKEAEDGDEVRPGRALIAPGGRHMRLRRANAGGGYTVSIESCSKVNGHMPSVDVLFESVSEAAGADAIGVILSGMGSDGANGLKKIREAGGYTIGQDERSSIVYGMPMAAYTAGAVMVQLSLYRIPDEIIRKLESRVAGS